MCMTHALPLDTDSERRLAWLLEKAAFTVRDKARNRRAGEVHVVVVLDNRGRVTNHSRVRHEDHPPE